MTSKPKHPEKKGKENYLKNNFHNAKPITLDVLIKIALFLSIHMSTSREISFALC